MVPFQLAIFDNWEFIATENKWITNKMALEWLEKVFILQTAPCDYLAKLLILNGYCHDKGLGLVILFILKKTNEVRGGS